MAHDVFISYSSKDKPIADAVCNGLENEGIRCWMAPRDILPGTNWGESIINAIGSSKAMVIVFSANSNSSTQVLREVERAVSKNVIIIPFRIEDIIPSGAMEYFIGTEHWLDAMNPPMEDHIRRLSSTLQTLLTIEGEPKPRPVKPATRKIFGLTRIQLALVAIGVAVLGLICLVGAGFGVFKFITSRLSPTPGQPTRLAATFTPQVAGGLPATPTTALTRGVSSPTSESPGATLTAVSPPAGPSGATWLLLTDLPRTISALAVDPTNPQIIYAGTEVYGQSSGFVYKSEDGGLTWKIASTGLDNRAISSLAISNTNPPVIYANTERNIYTSRDGAQSWQKAGENDVMGGVFSTHLYISPTDNKVLFITEDINSFSRSLDGGQNWTGVTIAGLPTNVLGQTVGVSLAFDPSQPSTIYLGSEGVGVYKSTDGGDTWAAANKGMLDYKINALAVDPSQTQVVFAGSDRGKLFRSQDSGGSWEDITSRVGYPTTGYTGEILNISIDPSGAIYILAQGSGLFTSSDGGEKWRSLGKPGSVENPTFSSVAYIFGPQPVFFLGVQEAGAWRYSADQPAQAPTPTLPGPKAANPAKLPVGSWQALADLPRRINSLAVDPTNVKIIYAGAGIYGSGGGGVYKSEDNGLTWTAASSGLGNEVIFAVAASALSPGAVYAAAGVRGDVFISQDGAQTWQKAGVNNIMVGNMKTTLMVSPRDGKTLVMLQDLGQFMRSVDGGQNWIPSTLGEAVPQGGYAISVLSAIFDPSDPNVLYAGTRGFGVWKSTDGGDTWRPSNKGMLDYEIVSLAMDPSNNQVLYAGGADRNGLFKSIDGGLNWVNLTTRLPFQDARYVPTIQFIFIDPNATDTVYLLIYGTGLVGSTDGGLTWRILGKPGSVNNPNFTAAWMVFTPQPLLIAGINDSGGWRYSVP